jgi:hypothetical protein
MYLPLSVKRKPVDADRKLGSSGSGGEVDAELGVGQLIDLCRTPSAKIFF